MSEFCHLHCHSNRSFFDGLAPVPDLVEQAAKLGQPGIALTDHGNVFGAAQFFAACKEHGIKGMIGMEAYEAVPHEWDVERDKHILTRKFDSGQPRYHHLTIWCATLEGWHNLCALHGQSFTKNYRPKNQPLLDRASLERHHEGLMIGLGCMASKTNFALANEGLDAAYEAAKWYVEVFEGRVYCEVMANLPEQQAALRDQRKLAQKLGLTTVADNDVHYLERQDGVEGGTHHTLVQARAHRKKDVEKSDDRSEAGYGQWYGTDEFFLKSEQEMLETSGLRPDEIARTAEVMARCEFDFDALGRPAPPVAPVPEPGDDPAFDSWIEMAA